MKPNTNTLKTGFPILDKIIGIDSGIVTLRSRSMSWLSLLSTNILVRNHERDRKSLYLHWVDYHKRYWTLDYDKISRLCKSLGKDVDSLSDNTYFIRAFSRDNTETEENWKRILGFSNNLKFTILDSVSELFETEEEGKPVQKNIMYAIGKFSRLCMMNDCVGFALDHSKRNVHPYLGEVSSIVLDFEINKEVSVNIIKHPSLSNSTIKLGIPKQNSLRWWLS